MPSGTRLNCLSRSTLGSGSGHLLIQAPALGKNLKAEQKRKMKKEKNKGYQSSENRLFLPQPAILLYPILFDFSSIFPKIKLICFEKVKCPDGHLCLSLRPPLHPPSTTQKHSGGTYSHSHTPFSDRKNAIPFCAMAPASIRSTTTGLPWRRPTATAV